MRRSPTFAAAIAVILSHTNMAGAESLEVARGKYLVQLGGCNDCHTAGYLLGKADTSRYLGGSDVGFEVPGLGVFVAPNLTPDKDTGLGNWTRQEIVTAIRTGTRPDSRILAPIMPWRAFATLTDVDAGAIADFLKSLPPVVHKVPGPFGPNEKVPVPRMTVVPPTAQR
jgi:mono/diheme cytochrome c family protein